VAAEAEPGPERQTHQPVSGEVTEHGRAGVAGAAQGAGGHGLDAVEELKGGAGGKENDGVADDGGVVRVDAATRRGKTRSATLMQDMKEAREGWRVTSIASAQRIAAADACPTRTAAAEEMPKGTM